MAEDKCTMALIRITHWMLVTIVLVTTAFCCDALAGDRLELDSVGFDSISSEFQELSTLMWTDMGACDIQGDLAYCSVARGLMIIDVSNPARANCLSWFRFAGQGDSVLDSYSSLMTFRQEITVADSIAYVAIAGAGLVIANCSNPVAPVFVRRLSEPGEWAWGVNIVDSFLVVSTGSQVIEYNMSDRLDPRYVSHTPQNSRRSPVQCGDHVYVFSPDSAGTSCVRSVGRPNSDCSPATVDWPQRIDGAALCPPGLLLWGDQGRGSANIYIYDVTEPASPIRRALFPLDETVSEIDCDGELVCAVTSTGLRFLESTPNPPFLQEISRTASDATHATVIGRTVFASGSYGLGVHEVDSLGHVQWRGGYEVPSKIEGIATDGKMVYVACGISGLWLVDIRDPRKPEVRSIYYESHGFVESVELTGRYAIVAHKFHPDWNNFLDVVDVSDPDRPTRVARTPIAGRISSTTLDAGILYVLDDGGHLLTFDVSQVPKLLALGTLSIPDGSIKSDLTVSDGVAFCTYYGQQVFAIDVSPASDLRLLATIKRNTYVGGLAVRERHLFVETRSPGAEGLQVYSIATVTRPRLIAQLEEPLPLSNTIWHGDTAISGQGEVAVIDVSKPSAPKRIDTYDTHDNIVRMVVSDSILIVACEHGVDLLRMPNRLRGHVEAQR